MNTSERYISAASDPFTSFSARDDAYRWHALDTSLVPLARARDGLERVGYEVLAEEVDELIEAVKVEHETVERLVTATLAREE